MVSAISHRCFPGQDGGPHGSGVPESRSSSHLDPCGRPQPGTDLLGSATSVVLGLCSRGRLVGGNIEYHGTQNSDDERGAHL